MRSTSVIEAASTSQDEDALDPGTPFTSVSLPALTTPAQGTSRVGLVYRSYDARRHELPFLLPRAFLSLPFDSPPANNAAKYTGAGRRNSRSTSICPRLLIVLVGSLSHPIQCTSGDASVLELFKNFH